MLYGWPSPWLQFKIWYIIVRRFFYLEFRGLNNCHEPIFNPHIKVVEGGKVLKNQYRNFQDLSSIEECKLAAIEHGKNFSQVWKKDSLPRRCHIMYSDVPGQKGDQIVYWNDHITGGASENASPICKAGKMVKHKTHFSIFDKIYVVSQL